MSHEFDLPSPDHGNSYWQNALNNGQLYLLREQYAASYPQTPEIIEQTLQHTLPSLQATVLEALEVHKDFIPHMARMYAEGLQQPVNSYISRWISCRIVHETSNFLQRQALERHLQGLPQEFPLWYDISTGVASSIRGMQQADVSEEIFVATLKQAELHYDEFSTLSFSIAQKHILTRAAQTMREEATRILTDDPTGFTLIESNIGLLQEVAKGQNQNPFKTGVLLYKFQTPEYVTTGAELGLSIYQTVYPLTEKPISAEG